MAFERAPLTMYTAPTDHEPLEWDWVAGRLAAAGLYWVVASGPDPHPRPVWGVWIGDQLMLSLGSPTLRRAVASAGSVTVHLESGTDVVVLSGPAATDDAQATVEAFVTAYDAKYDYSYDAATYGPPTVIDPAEVMAWRAAGVAGRDGFTHSGKWVRA